MITRRLGTEASSIATLRAFVITLAMLAKFEAVLSRHPKTQFVSLSKRDALHLE